MEEHEPTHTGRKFVIIQDMKLCRIVIFQNFCISLGGGVDQSLVSSDFNRGAAIRIDKISVLGYSLDSLSNGIKHF